jgi:replication-associated recombination protein RarA
MEEDNRAFTIKYKPKSLDDWVCPNQEVAVAIGKFLRKNPPMPHIFYGHPGGGKTTLAELLPLARNPNYNMADYKLVSCTRVNASAFLAEMRLFGMGRQFGDDLRTLVLDEFDDMPPALQAEMRGVFDEIQGHTVIIMTTNHINKINNAIRSRAKEVHIPVPDKAAWLTRMKTILAAEHIGGVSDERLIGVQEENARDNREILSALEDAIDYMRHK